MGRIAPPAQKPFSPRGLPPPDDKRPPPHLFSNRACLGSGGSRPVDACPSIKNDQDDPPTRSHPLFSSKREGRSRSPPDRPVEKDTAPAASRGIRRRRWRRGFCSRFRRQGHGSPARLGRPLTETRGDHRLSPAAARWKKDPTNRSRADVRDTSITSTRPSALPPVPGRPGPLAPVRPAFPASM